MTRAEFLRSLLPGIGLPGAFQGGPGSLSDAGTAASDLAWLEEWKSLPLVPVVRVPGNADVPVGLEPRLGQLLDAIRRERPVEFRYHGGSEPGAERKVHPLLVFVRPRPRDVDEWVQEQHAELREEGEEASSASSASEPEAMPTSSWDPEAFADWLIERRRPVYLMAWCRRREAARVFRVDRVEMDGAGEELTSSRLAKRRGDLSGCLGKGIVGRDPGTGKC